MSIPPQRLKETHYNTREAGKILKVTADTVKRYCNQNPPRIKGKKLFGERGPWFISRSAIEKYLTEESSTGRPKASRYRNGRKSRAG